MILMLFNRHRLFLGINCIFRDLSANLISLHPMEPKEIARQFCMSCIRQALKNSRNTCICIFSLSFLKNHQPNQLKIHLVKEEEILGFVFNNDIFGCASSKRKLNSQFKKPAIRGFFKGSYNAFGIHSYCSLLYHKFSKHKLHRNIRILM